MGGTFDPIHNGHLEAAEAVTHSFKVDEVHFIPSFSPPHKSAQEITSPFHRFAMVALATQPFAGFRPSALEVDALEKRYSVETLELMRTTYPGAQFLFIMGTDMYQEIHTWREFRRLFELAHLAIVNRPGFPLRSDVAPVHTVSRTEKVQLPETPRVFHLPFVEQPISSTEIRNERRRGRAIQQWLPPPVWSYIERNKLYT